MTARPSKSKRPSDGSVNSPSRPDEFVLYLDENLCNTKALLEVLTRSGVRFERHLDHFPRGTSDDKWLPLVGNNGWVLLTADKRIRYNLLEKSALRKYGVREFVFASGNMSGKEMAAALEAAIHKMQKFSGRFQPPFVAAITRSGEIHLRWPKKNPKGD